MDVTITRNDEAGRFEVEGAPEVGRLDFRHAAGRLVLVHTEVADDREGEGLGSALVRAALEDADARGLTVVVRCPFVASWLRRHPERAAALDIADR